MKAPVVVIGAAGGVGSGIVEALIQADHPVIAVGRNGAALSALAERIAQPQRLTLLPGSVCGDDSALALTQALRNLRTRFAGVVAGINTPREGGRLLNRPADFLTRTLERNVVAHFAAAKHLLPMLADTSPNALYLILGGASAEFAWAGYGHVSIANAALKMLLQVIREEAKDLPLRIQQLMLTKMVRTHLNQDCACPEWVTAGDVGREVATLIESSNGLAPVVPFNPRALPNRSA